MDPITEQACLSYLNHLKTEDNARATEGFQLGRFAKDFGDNPNLFLPLITENYPEEEQEEVWEQFLCGYNAEFDLFAVASEMAKLSDWTPPESSPVYLPNSLEFVRFVRELARKYHPKPFFLPFERSYDVKKVDQVVKLGKTRNASKKQFYSLVKRMKAEGLIIEEVPAKAMKTCAIYRWNEKFDDQTPINPYLTDAIPYTNIETDCLF